MIAPRWSRQVPAHSQVRLQIGGRPPGSESYGPQPSACRLPPFWWLHLGCLLPNLQVLQVPSTTSRSSPTMCQTLQTSTAICTPSPLSMPLPRNRQFPFGAGRSVFASRRRIQLKRGIMCSIRSRCSTAMGTATAASYRVSTTLSGSVWAGMRATCNLVTTPCVSVPGTAERRGTCSIAR